jgi:hypothetical protein
VARRQFSTTHASAAAAIVLALAVLAFALRFGARTAGGSDALGYVSQAHLILHGQLRTEDHLSRSAHWPFAADSMAPLGFVPGSPRGTIVPLYSPGTPLIMAAAIRLLGNCGPFFVAPFCASLLVLATWLLAQRVTSNALTSAVTAALTATSPVLLINAPLPMSDTVMAALTTTALAMLTFGSLSASAAAGLLTTLAIAVRPNLAPIAIAFALATFMWGERNQRFRRAIAFGLCVLPGPILVAIINAHLHGSPLRSGYGSFSHLYALSNVPGNIARYVGWLVESHGWLAVALACAAILSSLMRPRAVDRRSVLPLGLFAIVLTISYLVYLQFDGWTFLRFFLPGLPLFYALIAITLTKIARQRSPIAIPAFVVLTAYIVTFNVWFGQRKQATLIGPGERRYAAVADFVNRSLPPNAAIIAMQHTGSVAFYTGRLTLRYDRLPGHRLSTVIEWLQRNGYRPYIVLEDWEEPHYRQHFTEADRISRLDIAPIVETVPGIRVRVYDAIDPRPSGVRPSLLDVNRVSECQPPAPGWTKRLRK